MHHPGANRAAGGESDVCNDPSGSARCDNDSFNKNLTHDYTRSGMLQRLALPWSAQ